MRVLGSSLHADKLSVGLIGSGLALLSWLVVILRPSMPMSGAVDSIALLLFVTVWAVGMVAMMLPSLLPMIFMVLAAAKKQNLADDSSPASVRMTVQPIEFALGYFGIWSSVGLAAYFGIVFLFRFYPSFSSSGELTGAAAGVAVLLAGVYQLSPLKQKALQVCRSPMNFIMTRWRSGRFARLLMGLDYGFFCTKCCWAFMAVLVVVGAMNLLWMVLFAGAIFVEKAAPRGVVVSKGLGILLVTAGLILVIMSS